MPLLPDTFWLKERNLLAAYHRAAQRAIAVVQQVAVKLGNPREEDMPGKPYNITVPRECSIRCAPDLAAVVRPRPPPEAPPWRSPEPGRRGDAATAAPGGARRPLGNMLPEGPRRASHKFDRQSTKDFDEAMKKMKKAGQRVSLAVPPKMKPVYKPELSNVHFDEMLIPLSAWLQTGGVARACRVRRRESSKKTQRRAAMRLGEEEAQQVGALFQKRFAEDGYGGQLGLLGEDPSVSQSPDEVGDDEDGEESDAGEDEESEEDTAGESVREESEQESRGQNRGAPLAESIGASAGSERGIVGIREDQQLRKLLGDEVTAVLPKSRPRRHNSLAHPTAAEPDLGAIHNPKQKVLAFFEGADEEATAPEAPCPSTATGGSPQRGRRLKRQDSGADLPPRAVSPKVAAAVAAADAWKQRRSASPKSVPSLPQWPPPPPECEKEPVRQSLPARPVRSRAVCRTSAQQPSMNPPPVLVPATPRARPSSATKSGWVQALRAVAGGTSDPLSLGVKGTGLIEDW